MKGHIKLLCINIAIFFGVILAVFAGGEVYLRMKYDISKPYWPGKVDPQIGSFFKSGEYLYMTDNYGYFQKQKVNNLGFLDRDYIEDDSKKVVFIGDSFVEAVQVEIAKKSHVVLESMLQKAYPEDNYKTYALGCSGTGQINQLAYYDHVARKMEPEVVVLVIVNNDFSNNHHMLESLRNGLYPNHHSSVTAVAKNDSFVFVPADTQWFNHRFESGGGTVKEIPLLKDIYEYSAFYRLLVKVISSKYTNLAFLSGTSVSSEDVYVDKVEKLNSLNVTPRILPSDANVDDFSAEKLSPLKAEALVFTDFALAEWKKRADRDDFKLVALLSHTVSGYCSENSLYKDRFVELLEKNDIPYADQCDVISKAGGTSADANFRYDGHWNEQGHQWGAETIFPLIHEK